jgi:phenylalanyl-tRNA synthetase beta chain
VFAARAWTADQIDGLLILPPDAPVGKLFAGISCRSGSDVVYDLEITPNRPDWNSVIGIAREIAALTGNRLKLPETGIASGPISVADAPAGSTVDNYVAVRIEDPELCPRYMVRVVRGVKIGPSPDWLRSTLEKVGIRSINNVVDVTNYVMLETGQPLHAFDYHLIAKERAVQRPAGESWARQQTHNHHSAAPEPPKSSRRSMASNAKSLPRTFLSLTKKRESPLPEQWAAQTPRSI